MISHLKEHVKQGSFVPESTFERLQKENEENGNSTNKWTKYSSIV